MEALFFRHSNTNTSPNKQVGGALRCQIAPSSPCREQNLDPANDAQVAQQPARIKTAVAQQTYKFI
jgi:hypothetical protein